MQPFEPPGISAATDGNGGGTGCSADAGPGRAGDHQTATPDVDCTAGSRFSCAPGFPAPEVASDKVVSASPDYGRTTRSRFCSGRAAGCEGWAGICLARWKRTSGQCLRGKEQN